MSVKSPQLWLLGVILCGLLLLSGCGGSEPTFTLTVSADGQGSVIKDPDQATYANGTQVTLTAVPNTNWEFSRWEGNISGAQNPTTVTLTANVTVKAVFIAVNQAPVLEPIGQKTITAGDLLSIQVTATDADSDTLTFSASGDLTQYFNPASHTFVWNSTYTDSGQYTITFKVSDGQLAATETITILVNEKILHVPADHSKIQKAIDAASDGMIIEVAPGTYNENIDFKGKAITVRSSNPTDLTTVENTKINGMLSGPVVSLISGEPAGTILEGFTIYNGKDLCGGGVLVNNDARPTIRNNRISNNEGTGIGVFGNSQVQIIENLIAYNVCTNCSGGILISDSGATIKRNKIWSNQAYIGGGIWVSNYSTATITENEIYFNEALLDGAGIVVTDATVVIQTNYVHKNTTPCFGGGIATARSQVDILDNTVQENSAASASGIFCSGEEVKITGNQILANHADDLGGGIYVSEVTGEIHDNLIKNNTAGESGGGIAVRKSTPAIWNNTIEANEATTTAAGILVNEDSTPKIYGNTLKDHTNSGIFVSLTSNVKTVDGTTWPRTNATPANPEPTNTYENNTPYDVFFMKLVPLSETEQ